MESYNSGSVNMYCQNCGHKVTGCRSCDRMARFNCDRCGSIWTSRKKDKRTIDTRMTAPPNQAAYF